MIPIFHHLPLGQTNLIELQVSYSIPVVILSILLACVASYTALAMNERVTNNSFFHKNFWFVLASVAMGGGIWAVHFVGMLAFTLPVSMNYDYLLTIVSIIPAVLASFFAFYLANRPKQPPLPKIISSSIMGLGTACMHYIGMAAIQTEAIHTYSLELVIVTILISSLVFFIFTSLQRYMGNYLVRLLAALIMGLLIAGMHYMGMFAMTFYVPESYPISSTGVQMFNMNLLVISVMIGMSTLLGALILSSLGDRYVGYRANYYDTLTKLPNRRMFEKNMGKVEYTQLAIWHLHDLEFINREHGYLFGDLVIQHLATLLSSHKPSMTDLYRIEGNHFAFLSRKIEDGNSLLVAMEKAAEIVRRSIVIHTKEVNIQAVCAVSITNHIEETSQVYANVLAVLNHPSIQFNHEIVLYDSKIHTFTFDHEIVEDIVSAMEEEQLFLVYQPKVNGQTAEVLGVEALLRWNHPSHGFLSPEVFIPILESNNRILDVTDWVIERVCRQMTVWQKEGISFHQVAINIPGQYVTSPRLLDVLKRTLNQYQLKPHQLELEITETSFVKNMEEAIKAVGTFRLEGFSVALDDFGTGVSSLSYLKKMPISTLKIDKSFIDGVPESEIDASIMQAIIALGESLHLTIVFEGVETKEQVEFLVTACVNPIIQGYYFAKPMKADELVEWSKAFNRTTRTLI